jgi:hypothetical protein
MKVCVTDETNEYMVDSFSCHNLIVRPAMPELFAIEMKIRQYDLSNLYSYLGLDIQERTREIPCRLSIFFDQESPNIFTHCFLSNVHVWDWPSVYNPDSQSYTELAWLSLKNYKVRVNLKHDWLKLGF